MMKRESIRRGSILDLFLIFLFLLCLLGILLRYQEGRRGEDEVVLASYTLTAQCERIDPQTAACLREGDLLYDSTGAFFGRVRSVETLPAKVTLISQGKTYSGTWDPAIYCDLILEIDVEAGEGDGILLHGGRVPLAVGENLSLRSERVFLSLKLYKMTLSQT